MSLMILLKMSLKIMEITILCGCTPWEVNPLTEPDQLAIYPAWRTNSSCVRKIRSCAHQWRSQREGGQGKSFPLTKNREEIGKGKEREKREGEGERKNGKWRRREEEKWERRKGRRNRSKEGTGKWIHLKNEKTGKGSVHWGLHSYCMPVKPGRQCQVM